MRGSSLHSTPPVSYSEESVVTLNAIPRSLYVQKIDLVNLILVNHHRKPCRIFESHFANPEGPQHNFKKILICDALVPLDSCYPRAKDRSRNALLGVHLIDPIPELDQEL